MPSTGPSYWILKCCLLRTLTGLPPPFLSARVWYIFCLLSGINPGSHCSPCINSRWERINKMSRCGTNRLLKRADPVRCTGGTRAAGAAGNFNYVKVAATSNAALNMWWYTKKKIFITISCLLPTPNALMLWHTLLRVRCRVQALKPRRRH